MTASDPFTKINAAKFVVKAIVHTTVSQRTQTTITDYTRLEEDDTIVPVAGYLVGWYVSDKLRPTTDKMVDKTANFVADKRDAYKAKKNTK